MRLFLLIFVLLLTQSLCIGQTNSVNRVYFFAAEYDTITVSTNDYECIAGAIKIGRCTLLETNMNEVFISNTTFSWLGLSFTRESTYYKQVGNFSLYSRVHPLTKEEFDQKVNEKGPGVYRHYFLDKKLGLKLIAQKG